MVHLSKEMDDIIETYLKPIDENWQPADFLPQSNDPNFLDEVKELQKECKELPYDYLAV
jgi:acyl-[acyl-carrier-protein] desaturase